MKFHINLLNILNDHNYLDFFIYLIYIILFASILYNHIYDYVEYCNIKIIRDYIYKSSFYIVICYFKKIDIVTSEVHS